MLKAADTASRLLKTLSHRDRLMILCQLNDGEHSVSQLAEMLDIQQSPLSQHLARMRKEGLVKTRRVAQTIYYSIDSPEASRIIATLYDIFCNPEIS
ncbi:MAG: winged helix-turn-helix transcriptional regulator [Gammaproteobacteria bacterium]|nr:metalloregulator ArsR/SmtB family transcription factor [Gammaproteobacteria bacterium]NNC97216.1 winged helix-turn-helix transcriptional regulator [Gammaproteobacteria bacterium]NNM15003.1 winged helix-turn-helix transcriptional regulator [Gammaproteobacteria bacterium]